MTIAAVCWKKKRFFKKTEKAPVQTQVQVSQPWERPLGNRSASKIDSHQNSCSQISAVSNETFPWFVATKLQSLLVKGSDLWSHLATGTILSPTEVGGADQKRHWQVSKSSFEIALCGLYNSCYTQLLFWQWVYTTATPPSSPLWWCWFVIWWKYDYLWQ